MPVSVFFSFPPFPLFHSFTYDHFFLPFHFLSITFPYRYQIVLFSYPFLPLHTSPSPPDTRLLSPRDRPSHLSTTTTTTAARVVGRAGLQALQPLKMAPSLSLRPPPASLTNPSGPPSFPRTSRRDLSSSLPRRTK